MKIKNQGFTILEIMVVVVIMGVLAMIAFPTFTNHTSMAEDAKKITFIHNSDVILLATRTSGTDYPYDKIADGINATTLSDIKDILRKNDLLIPSEDSDYKYWYFSAGNDYIVASCSKETKGEILTMGTSNSETQIECLAANYYKIPTAKIGGVFDGGTNFKLIP